MTSSVGTKFDRFQFRCFSFRFFLVFITGDVDTICLVYVIEKKSCKYFSKNCLILFIQMCYFIALLNICNDVHRGNFIGDPGARLLSKALQINTSVQTLSIDRNSITVHGYSDIAYALER